MLTKIEKQEDRGTDDIHIELLKEACVTFSEYTSHQLQSRSGMKRRCQGIMCEILKPHIIHKIVPYQYDFMPGKPNFQTSINPREHCTFQEHKEMFCVNTN